MGRQRAEAIVPVGPLRGRLRQPRLCGRLATPLMHDLGTLVAVGLGQPPCHWRNPGKLRPHLGRRRLPSDERKPGKRLVRPAVAGKQGRRDDPSIGDGRRLRNWRIAWLAAVESAGRVARGNLTPGLPQNPGVTVSRHRALLTSYQYARTHRQWANRPGCLESSPVHHRLNRLKVRSRLYFFPAQRLR